MKKISIVGLFIVLSACSTHVVKCHGPVRPINEPAASAAKSAPGSQPSSPSGGAQKRDGSADPFRTEPQQ